MNSKKFTSSLTFLLAALLITQPFPLYADTYVKSQVIMAGETHSWLSGMKKRVETKLPLIGKVVIITRVGQGIEWILYPEKKIYQEKPIALPYLKDEKDESTVTTDITPYLPHTDEEELAKQCVPELRRLPGNKMIAGFKTTGFTAICGNETVPGKIWMAPPVGRLAEVAREDAAYNHAHAAALFSKYPPGDREDLAYAAENAGDLLKKFFTDHMAKGTRFPPGVMMAMEGSAKKGPAATIFEIREITNGPVDTGLFEIPSGYQKVPDLTKAVLQSGLQRLNTLMQAGEAVKNFFSKAGMTGAGAEGNPLAGIIERIKKAMQGFSQNSSS